MEINTNELTRPFRIPRKKAGDSSAVDSAPDKTKRRRLASGADLRSPLVSAAANRKSDSAFSSRIVPPTKKMPPAEHNIVGRKSTANKTTNSSGGEMLDKILGEMVQPPRDRRREALVQQEETEGVAGPSALPSASNRPAAPTRASSLLTREELERRQQDNSACYAFMQREGLMERLLGHKMLTGRVDSHVVLGFVQVDSKDITPTRSSKAANNNAISTKHEDTGDEQPGVATFIEERRGPKTPPGSPKHDEDSSLLSSRGVGSASPTSPPPPPPADEFVEQQSEKTPNLIVEMAELTRLPHSQLADCLGEELQKAMKEVDHTVLLNTLKDALLKVGRRNEIEKEKEQNKVEPVEMDIESNRSANEPVLPPPPPAPRTPPAALIPPLLVPSQCLLPTPPPPPPVMLLQSAPALAAAVTSGTLPPTAVHTSANYPCYQAESSVYDRPEVVATLSAPVSYLPSVPGILETGRAVDSYPSISNIAKHEMSVTSSLSTNMTRQLVSSAMSNIITPSTVYAPYASAQSILGATACAQSNISCNTPTTTAMQPPLHPYANVSGYQNSILSIASSHSHLTTVVTEQASLPTASLPTVIQSNIRQADHTVLGATGVTSHAQSESFFDDLQQTQASIKDQSCLADGVMFTASMEGGTKSRHEMQQQLGMLPTSQNLSVEKDSVLCQVASKLGLQQPSLQYSSPIKRTNLTSDSEFPGISNANSNDDTMFRTHLSCSEDDNNKNYLPKSAGGVLGGCLPESQDSTLQPTEVRAGTMEQVPTSQAVIKTLLTALSIPQNNNTNIGNTTIDFSGSKLPIFCTDAEQKYANENPAEESEVEFCWPPANFDEIDADISHTKQNVQGNSTRGSPPKMMFFNQPVTVKPVKAPPPLIRPPARLPGAASQQTRLLGPAHFISSHRSSALPGEALNRPLRPPASNSFIQQRSASGSGGFRLPPSGRFGHPSFGNMPLPPRMRVPFAGFPRGPLPPGFRMPPFRARQNRPPFPH